MTVALEPGTVFGRYRMVRRLAIGGMAEIWLAQSHESGGKPVVLKRILPQFAQDEELLERFRQEAELTLSLLHGNIVPVFEVGKVDDEPYMVMEYVPGRDLRQILRAAQKTRQRAPVGVASYVGIEVLRGLGYVHNKRASDGRPLRLIHRDVSPSNIVVSTEGTVKLLDFGIAKVFGRSRATRTGMLVGKVGYMSPEQVRGRPVTAKSDIFSTSVVLYELLAAQRLFDGDSEAEILEKVRSAPIIPLNLRNPSVPQKLQAIIEKGLSRDPADRYANAREYETELVSFLSSAGWPGDADATIAFVKELFPDEDANTGFREVSGPAFVTGTRTQAPQPSPPTGGPALLLGGAAGGTPSAPLQRSRGPLPVALGVAAVLSVAAVLAMVSGLVPGIGPKPTSPPVAATGGLLLVHSEPDKAEIWQDGENTHRVTPNIFEDLPLGDTRIEVRLPDYLPQEDVIHIKAGRNTHTFHLVPDYRHVTIDSNPPGAIITVAGRAPKKAPATFNELLPSQELNVTAELSGHYPEKLDILVAKADESMVIPLRKRPITPKDFVMRAQAPGTITLRVSPWAFVKLDDKPQTDKPIRAEPVTPGTHQLLIQNPELKIDLSCTLEVEPHEQLNLSIDLNKDPSCPPT